MIGELSFGAAGFPGLERARGEFIAFIGQYVVNELASLCTFT